uniref:Disease resistance R13L4/SHOC-2-like LRR domain-containing protein n=1 Tax=Oryza meridionalis TaxID=40149 RepID=A0A0E0F6I5_9ORYZ
MSMRSLDLWGTSITELPKDIKNLRFLKVQYINETKIKELPSTFVQLEQLGSLFFYFKIRLPDGFGNLKSLQELGGDIIVDSPTMLEYLVEEPTLERDERLTTGDAYPFMGLTCFSLYDDAMEVAFAKGAMPKLRTLSLRFEMQNTKELFGGDMDLGLENLSSLQDASIQLVNCYGAVPEEIEAVKDALRKAVTMNPNNPTLRLQRYFPFTSHRNPHKCTQMHINLSTTARGPAASVVTRSRPTVALHRPRPRGRAPRAAAVVDPSSPCPSSPAAASSPQTDLGEGRGWDGRARLPVEVAAAALPLVDAPDMESEVGQRVGEGQHAQDGRGRHRPSLPLWLLSSQLPSWSPSSPLPSCSPSSLSPVAVVAVHIRAVPLPSSWSPSSAPRPSPEEEAGGAAAQGRRRGLSGGGGGEGG